MGWLLYGLGGQGQTAPGENLPAFLLGMYSLIEPACLPAHVLPAKLIRDRPPWRAFQTVTPSWEAGMTKTGE